MPGTQLPVQANRWGNVFSNETALFHMSDGSSCRINEFRRIGHPEVVRMSLFGTAANFAVRRCCTAGTCIAGSPGARPPGSLGGATAVIGSGIKRWSTGELSIVDRPCLPSATFVLWR